MDILPAKNIAANVSLRLVQIANELLVAYKQGKPKDNDKYVMVSNLLIKFTTIADAALQEEENSKEGITFLHKISTDVDTAMESIEILLDEFYDSQKTTFNEFDTSIKSFINMSITALTITDLKSFLLLFGEIEEGRKVLDYIPYNDCDWSDNEFDMCDNYLDVLDRYFTALLIKQDELLIMDYTIH